MALQIALSLLLLVTAGLFVRTLGNLEAVPLGFNPDGLLLFSLDPTAAGYSPEQKAQATERIAERSEAGPARQRGDMVDVCPGGRRGLEFQAAASR